MSTILIVNPHARQGRAGRLFAQIEPWLAEQAPSVSAVLCGTPEKLAEVFDALPQNSRVIAVGGDGTNHRMLPYLLAGGHSYGLVPYGSGDDVARAVNLYGMDWKAALHHAIHAPTEPVDVAFAQDLSGTASAPWQRHFLGCFTFGLDGHISNQTQGWKIQGPLPYFITLLKELRQLKGWHLELNWQGRDGCTQTLPKQELILCSVLNTPTYGSGYPIAPMADVQDRTLNLLYAPRVSRLKFLELFFKMTRARHVGTGLMQFHDCVNLEVRCDHELCISADGEILDVQSRHMRIEVLSGALQMVVGPQCGRSKHLLTAPGGAHAH